MKAIVLSGGGSKGSYEIGVWKALRILNIKYDIVTGTSVGALNGLLMTQKTYYKALKIWKNINLKTLFGENAIESNNNKEVLNMYKDNFLKNGGMDYKNLENLISKSINYKKFYKSNINYGLVTYNLTNLKPLQIEKNNIPKEKLKDYVMASAACFPAFKQKTIDNKKYIDGGVYDNLPISFAINLGADEIIAIDLNAPGRKKLINKNIKITTIKPNNKLSNFLNFNKKESIKNIKYGYNDTMKIYNKLEGNKYTFKKNTIKKCINNKDIMYKLLKETINNEILIDNIKKTLKITNNFNEEEIKKLTIYIIESLGKTYKLDDTKIYSYKKYNKLLKTKFINSNNTNKQKIIKNMYNKLVEKNYNDLKKDIIIHPIEYLKALYLFIIIEG